MPLPGEGYGFADRAVRIGNDLTDGHPGARSRNGHGAFNWARTRRGNRLKRTDNRLGTVRTYEFEARDDPDVLVGAQG